MGIFLETRNITTKQNTAFSTTIVPPAGYKLGHIHIVDSAGAESEIDVLPAQELSYLLSLPLPPQKIDVCVYIPELLKCMPTQMIQYNSSGVWACYQVDINVCGGPYRLMTMSARKIKAGSSMKWTEQRPNTGWTSPFFHGIMSLADAQARGGIPPSSAGAINDLCLEMQFAVNWGLGIYRYYDNILLSETAYPVNQLLANNFELTITTEGYPQLKVNGVVAWTGNIAFPLNSNDFIFYTGHWNGNGTDNCTSNFRFENMGATANWTVI